VERRLELVGELGSSSFRMLTFIDLAATEASHAADGA
jgi:hypothetical protein